MFLTFFECSLGEFWFVMDFKGFWLHKTVLERSRLFLNVQDHSRKFCLFWTVLDRFSMILTVQGRSGPCLTVLGGAGRIKRITDGF